MLSGGGIDQFQAASLSIATHPIEKLVSFPDSRTFYAGDRKTLPPAVKSLVYTATCNRIEVYLEKSPDAGANDVKAAISSLPYLEGFYDAAPTIYAGVAALEHVIAVASGLKSIALGETQIAGQLKRDLTYAEAMGWVTPQMQTFLKKVQETQKLIRNQTDISKHAYSLMSLAARQANERGLAGFANEAPQLILVGASEMSAKVARFALKRSANFLLVRKDTSRPMNLDMQELITKYAKKFTVCSLSDFSSGNFSFVADAIVLASSNSEPLIDAALVSRLENEKKLKANAALVDLALPGNAAPDVTEKYNSRLISLDSLKKMSEAAVAERSASAAEAEPIIRRAVYQLWLDLLYRENANVVQDYLHQKQSQSESEWLRLSQEAQLSEKQKRIMYDFLKKERRRALQSHRKMILDLMVQGWTGVGGGTDANPQTMVQGRPGY